MSDDVAAFAFLAFVCGLSWGGWLAERKSAKSKRHDVGVVFLAAMFTKIQQNRKFVQPSAEIIVSHELELDGEAFTLSLKSDGTPA